MKEDLQDGVNDMVLEYRYFAAEWTCHHMSLRVIISMASSQGLCRHSIGPISFLHIIR